jgi:hypothetical protein
MFYAQPVHIALFITHLLDSGATHNTINSIIYSIKWVHGMCYKNNPTNNSYIVSLQESAKRAVRPLKQKKDPVSIEMLLEHGLSWPNIEAMFLCESRPTVKRIIIRFCSIVTSRVNNVT